MRLPHDVNAHTERVGDLLIAAVRLTWPTSDEMTDDFFAKLGLASGDSRTTRSIGPFPLGGAAAPLGGFWTGSPALDEFSIVVDETSPADPSRLSLVGHRLKDQLCEAFGPPTSSETGMNAAPRLSWQLLQHKMSLACYWPGERLGYVEAGLAFSAPLRQRSAEGEHSHHGEDHRRIGEHRPEVDEEP